MSEASELTTGVAAVFGAVVGVLGSIMAFSPRVRALERDATASEALRKEQRDSDSRMVDMELKRIRDDASRQYQELSKKIDEHHDRVRADCAQTARRELAMLQLLAQVAGKVGVNHRLTDSLQNILNSREENENG